MDNVEYVYTFGMTETELAEYLEQGETGVLALASDGDAYAVPVGYHFDDERLYVRLGVHDDSEKIDYLADTERATFLVYDGSDANRSWSVLARGRIRELSDEEQQEFSDRLVNESYQPIRVFGEDVSELDATIYEFEITELTGRRTGESI